MAEEILPNVYDLTCAERGARRYRSLYFVDDVPTLFDVGFADTAEVLFDEIDATGVDPERVILTHGDSDHVGGFDAVVDRYDVETWVPALTDLEARNEADHRFGDGALIGRFEAVHVPGHSHDNFSFLRADRGILVMGDSLFNADMRGHPPGNYILPPAVYSKDLQTAERNLERLLEFDFDTALLFHGSTKVEDAREKLDAFVNFPGKKSYVRRLVGEENWGPTI